MLKKINCKSLGFKLTATFLITTVLAIAILSGITYYLSYQLLVNNLGQRSLKIAEAAVKKIDTEAFQTLKTVEDEQTEAYQSMRKSLSDLREITGVKYIYTMRKDENGQFAYVVDGSAEEDLSHIGDTEETKAYYETTWKGAPYIDHAFEVGEWGATLSSYVPIKDHAGNIIGILGADYDVKAEYTAFQNYRNVLLIVLVTLAVITSTAGIVLSRRIIKPIKDLIFLMKKAQKGDLTVKAQIISEDEIGDLSNSFNIMLGEINHLITQVSQNSGQMSTLSTELSTSVQEISSQTEVVNQNVGQIAASMEETSAQLQQVMASGNKMTEDLKALLDQANSSDEAVKEIKARAEKMKNNAETSNRLAKTICKEKENQMLQAINAGKVVAEIKTMADVISAVAMQTNLLSLNASIEAARAGEQGKGFMVVAESVGTLAKQAAETVKDINALIEQVQQAFNHLSVVSKDMLSFVSEKVISDYQVLADTGVQYLQDAEFAGDLVSDFAGRSKDVLSSVSTVNDSIEHTAAAVQEVTACLQGISQNSGQIAAAVEEVAKIAEEQAGSAEELNSTVLGLFKA